MSVFVCMCDVSNFVRSDIMATANVKIINFLECDSK